MLGLLEILIIVMAATAVIAVYFFSVTRLIKSKLLANDKVVWVLAMIVFQVLGVIAFLIYHDYFLPRELRANQ